jgi:hypothetical protein
MAVQPPRRPSRAAQNIVLKQELRPTTAPSGQHLLFPVKEVEFDGVAMGVLSDGTPYLHLRGLAKLCGIDSGMLSRLVGNWTEERLKPRGQRIAELLAEQGFTGRALHITTMGPGGETPAYTDAVCMALLEYYAFDAKQTNPEVAQRNYRLLARTSFRKFIYDGCGYNPDAHIPESWRTFHERILLNDQMPLGYFSVFREIADLVVHMIKGGCPCDDHTVPDVSVGITWSTYWCRQGLERQYGERIKYPHNFPDWFPQAAANPVSAWIYPVDALGAFKRWLYDTYIEENFPKYVGSKVSQGVFLPTRGQALIASVQRTPAPRLPGR